jgi:hypothetical protein
MNSMQVYVEIFSNYHFILFNGIGCVGGDVVDGFILGKGPTWVVKQLLSKYE